MLATLAFSYDKYGVDNMELWLMLTSIKDEIIWLSKGTSLLHSMRNIYD